jgi:lipopolysaccharide transport system permease protein
VISEARELWRCRELLLAMTERELRIRYKNSILGFFWSLAMPLATVLVMTVVFKYLVGNQTPNYGAYVLAAYLPFVFINTALLDSAQAVISALPIIKRVYFPREILPLASVLANFIHFCLSILVFFGYLMVVWVATGRSMSPFGWHLLMLPPILLSALCFAAGGSLLISALNVFYEDVKHALTLLLYLIFFLTPVMYFSETVFHRTKSMPNGQWINLAYHANPLASAVTSFRRALLPPTSVDLGGGTTVEALSDPRGFFLYFMGFSVALLFVGYAVFNRMKWRFVERP